MAVLQEENYKKIYDVVNSAGITNTDMTDVDNVIDVYNKIADWVNRELGDLFTASVVTVTEGSRYRVELRTITGAGIFYGYSSSGSSGAGSSTSPGYLFSATSRETQNSIAITNLRLMVIRSAHGYIADFFDASKSKQFEIGLLVTKGTNNADVEQDVTLIMRGNYLYVSTEPTTYKSASYYSSNLNSMSNKTALLTLIVPSTDLICYNVKECRGTVISDQTFFLAGGKTWCSINTGAGQSGLALLIE